MLFPFCTWQRPPFNYSACRNRILLFWSLTTFVQSGCTCQPPLVRLCATSHRQTKENYLFVCLPWHPFLLWSRCLQSHYPSWHAPSGSNTALLLLGGMSSQQDTSPKRAQPRTSKQVFPLSPPPSHALLPLTHDLTMSYIGGEVQALRVPFFHVCPKSACCSCVCHGWPTQFAIRFLLYPSSPFLYGLPYLRTGPCLTMGFTFLQPTFFCYTFLPYHSIIPAVKLFASILLGLFEPVVYSSPNGPVRPLVLLLHYWRAPVSHLFSLWRPEPICFPWASSALFLTLHFHGLLLSSLSFPGPIKLSLILGAHGLTINPLLSLLSLLWAYCGPFSLLHIIYCPQFAFSLFSDSFKLIYLFKTHLFIS